MSLKDKLRFRVSYDSISIQPNRKITNSLLIYALIIVVATAILVTFKSRFGENGQIICIAVIFYFTVQGLADILLRLNVRYIFDRQRQAIYRENPPFGKRYLMKFHEATIFTNSESDSWHYSIGIKQKQFLRSYKISPNFGDGKSEEKQIMEFENDILAPIMELLEGQ